MRMAMSSPVWYTNPSMSNPPRSRLTRSRTTASTSALGIVWPPMAPMSALMTLTVTRMLSPPPLVGVHRSTSGRPHRPLLGSVPHAAFARSLAIALHPVRLTIPHAPSWNGEFFRGGFYPVAAGLGRLPRSPPAGLEEYFFHGSNTHPNTHDTVPCVPPQPRRSRGQGDNGAIARRGGARRAHTGTCCGVGESPSRRHRAVRAGGTSGRRIRRRPGGGGSRRGSRAKGGAGGHRVHPAASKQPSRQCRTGGGGAHRHRHADRPGARGG